jgi:hypothetical protein
VVGLSPSPLPSKFTRVIGAVLSRERDRPALIPLSFIGEHLKIAVLGAAPSSRKLAPFNDPNWEIWVCSPPNFDLPRQDAWFEMHNLDRKWNQVNAPWIGVLENHPRVYLAQPDKRLPNGIIYPKDEMLAEFGRYFFTSTISWMLALAISLKPDEIGLWGVDMSAAEELYTHQRPGCHYFIQEAGKRGIKVSASNHSDILNPPPLYGYKEFSRMWWKQRARKQELDERAAAARAKISKCEKELLIFQGALDDLEYVNNTYCPVPFDDVLGK